MAKRMIGISCFAVDARANLANIERAEALGIPAAWVGGSLVADPLMLCSLAAIRTKEILLGTSITTMWTRHPLALAGQAATISILSGGRFRLGVGTSYPSQMTGTWGVDFKRPLHHLAEYLTVLNSVLKHGEVDFDGDIFHVHAKLPEIPDTPVMISALQAGSFRLAARQTDGAIPWMMPIEHVKAFVLPLMRETAAAANHAVPPIIFQAPVLMESNLAVVRDTVRSRLAVYPTIPYYRAMFEAAGFEIDNDSWSDELIDAVVISGDEDTVIAKLRGLLDAGVGEVIAMPIGGKEAVERAWTAVANAARG